MSECDELLARLDEQVHAAEIGRILAVSDGVFAIALTLPVLQLTIRSGLSDSAFRRALGDVSVAAAMWVLVFLLPTVLFRVLDRGHPIADAE